jgi:DNA-binding MarR family transcriptional regulator
MPSPNPSRIVVQEPIRRQSQRMAKTVATVQIGAERRARQPARASGGVGGYRHYCQKRNNVLYSRDSQPGLVNPRRSIVEMHSSPFLQMFYYLKSVRISHLISEDISFAEYVMLQLITEMSNAAGSTDVWVSDIVKRVEVTPQAVSKLIHLAASKGYIERFENASDRRSTGIRITDLGRAVLSKTGEELIAFRESVLREFSEEELALMYELMKKLQSAVQINYVKHIKK